MKELRRNMRLIGSLLLCCILVLIGYLNYTVMLNGNRWTNSSNNPRLAAARKSVIAGDIIDRNGVVLATTDDDGNRVYNSSSSLRRAVSQTVGDTLGMSGTGVETFYASTLLGLSSNIFDRLTQWISGTQQRGSDIHLTIDAELSKYIMEAFPEGKSGAVALLNYRTGDVYAMVSLPTYDPKRVARRSDEDEDAPYLNRATQGLYPPGSTFKIVTLAAALESLDGVDRREFYCSGEMAVGEGAVTDNEGNGHGDLTLESAFTRSCNLTFGSLALELGNGRLKSKAEAMGFNNNFLFRDIVVYESRFPDTESDFELAWSGVGQGRVLATPLHMAMIAGAVANDGVMMEPRLVSSIVGDSGIPQALAGASAYRRILSSGTAAVLKDYMEKTVSSGTGTRAQVDGYTIAGKTGTAEVSSSRTVKPHAWFVGYCADEEHPLALAIVVENGGHGGDVAAPLAAKVFKKAIKLGY